jgi:hypothetical protein
MKNKLSTILFTAFATVGVISLASSNLSSDPQPKPSPYGASSILPRWEYKVVGFDLSLETADNFEAMASVDIHSLDHTERRASVEKMLGESMQRNANRLGEKIQALGDRGWEFVGTLGDTPYVAFKRHSR